MHILHFDRNRQYHNDAMELEMASVQGQVIENILCFFFTHDFICHITNGHLCANLFSET